MEELEKKIAELSSKPKIEVAAANMEGAIDVKDACVGNLYHTKTGLIVRYEGPLSIRDTIVYRVFLYSTSTNVDLKPDYKVKEISGYNTKTLIQKAANGKRIFDMSEQDKKEGEVSKDVRQAEQPAIPAEKVSKRTKVGGKSKVAFMDDMLRAGKSDEEILKAVKEAFPDTDDIRNKRTLGVRKYNVKKAQAK